MTAVDWEEVKRLAADFQRAQLTSTSQALSERNCVEIISKLIESNLLDVIFTTDGKEYITPQYLVKEIKDELYVSGGRINLVELAKTLNVDLSHISAKIPEVEKSITGCIVVTGQLITKAYQKTVAQEINDRIQKVGQVVVGDLTKVYDLPGDFIQSIIEKNLGKIIQAKQDKSDPRVFYTEAFVSKNKSILRGALRALTRPTQVSAILSVTNLTERDFYFAYECMAEDKEVCGVLTGKQGGNTSFIPHFYTKQQNDWVESFYKQNGYLEYDALTRLGISDPVNFVRRHFPASGMLELPTCVIGPQLLQQVEAAVGDTLLSGTYLDVTMIVPSVLSTTDVGAILDQVLKKNKSKSIAHVLCDSVLVTDTFLQKVCEPFNEGILKEKAEKAVSSGAYIQAQAERKLGKVISNKEEVDTKTEKRDERRKKATGGKTGGGTQGRETKTKSTKKKYGGKGRGEPAEESDSDTEPVKKSGGLKLELISLKEIEKELSSSQSMQELVDIDEIVVEMAKHLQPLLNRKALDLASEAYEKTLLSSMGQRRQTHGDLQERIDTWLMELRLADKGIKLFQFEDTRQKLSSHLLKSTGSDMVNALFLYASDDPTVPSNSKDITPQMRAKMLTEIVGESKEVLTILNKCLSGSSVEDFLAAVEPALVSVGLLNRKPDKKKEKQFMQTKREQLLTEIGTTDNPATLLHMGLLLVFQMTTQTILNASGKFVTTILVFLHSHLPEEFFKQLSQFQDLVLKLLTVGDDTELETKLKSELNELTPSMKEALVTYRKQAQEKNG